MGRACSVCVLLSVPGCRSVYVSFGGLLMQLKGEEVYLKSIELGKTLYLLMRRI